VNNSDRSAIRAWQGFTFVCDTPKTTFNQNLNDSDNKIQSGSPVFPLSQAKQGEVVCIVTFNHLDNIDYLSSIGLIPGIEIQIRSCIKSGSVVVAWQNKCLGLGANIAARIMVKKDSLDNPRC
jgi:Fe2+ transport system protein FeoA